MLTIDIGFDLICPWCLIGKRQLKIALRKFRLCHPGVAIQVNWHPIQLLPELPANGVPFSDFYNNRLGSPAAVSTRQAQVRVVAAPLGLTINFEKIRIMPNTARAHALLAYVKAHWLPADYESLLDRLFAAYFVHGEDIGDPETLGVIGEDWGFTSAEVRDIVAQTSPIVLSSFGGQSVPYFVFNQNYALSGAYSADVLYQHMEAAVSTEVLA